MALTSTDQLHNQQLKIEQQKTEAAIQENNLLKQLMIGGKGGSPGQPYDDPEKGKGPFVPPPKSAGLRINPNTILLPKEPKEPETDEDYGEGEVGDGWKLSRANNIRGFQDKGYQLNIPLHDWKQIPDGIKNDPDFIRLHLRRMQALGINPNMLAGGPQLPNFKPMGPVRTGVRKGVLTPEENKIKRPLQIRGA